MIDFFELRENYRALAVKGMGTETKKDARVGLELDYYDGSGTKRSGKITKVGPKSYIVKDDKDGKNRQFLFHDRAKAKELLAKNESAELDESLELEEAVKVSRKDFDKLKKGSMITIDYGSSIRGSTERTFMVKGKSRSAKYNVDKVNMVDPKKPGGMKFHLYSRDGGDATLALGDMAATINSYSIKESVEESVKTEDKGQFIYAAKQAKAKGDSTFVFAGKTYNCEEVLGELSAKLLDKAAKKADDESDKAHHAKNRGRAGKKFDQATKFHKGAKDARRRAIRRGEKI